MIQLPTRFRLGFTVLAAGLSLAALSATAHASEWTDTDCASAALRIPGASTCKRIERVTGTGITGQIRGLDHWVKGTAGAYTFSATHFGPPPLLPNSLPGWKAYGVDRSEQIIRRNARAAAHDFGSYQGFDHTGYLQFRRGAQHCVGFDHGGAPTNGGYLYFVRGEICSASALRAPATLVKELLAAMEIAEPGQRVVSALGKPPAALTWTAQAAGR